MGKNDSQEPCNRSGPQYCSIQKGNTSTVGLLEDKNRTYLQIEITVKKTRDLCKGRVNNGWRLYNGWGVYRPFRCEGRDAPKVSGGTNCVLLHRIDGGGFDISDYTYLELGKDWGRIQQGTFAKVPTEAFHNVPDNICEKGNRNATIFFIYNVNELTIEQCLPFIQGYNNLVNTIYQDSNISINQKKPDPHMEFKVWNHYYSLCNQQNKNPFDSNGFSVWLSKTNTMNTYLGSNPNFTLPSFTKDGQPLNFIEYFCMKTTNKNCELAYPICTHFKSNDDINLRSVCDAYVMYLKGNNVRPSAKYDNLVKRICSGTSANDILLKQYECKCASRDTDPEYKEYTELFNKYGDSNTANIIDAPTCWYHPCGDDLHNWIDSNAYPPGNPPTCGQIRFCDQEINLKNNLYINSNVDLKNIGCGCTSDAQCKGGRKCRNNQCVECDNTLKCPNGLRCVNGTCVECENDGQCSVNEICYENKCVECTPMNKTFCSPTETCVNYKCIECSDDIKCQGGKQCINNKCIECVKDSDCDEGYQCINNKCILQDNDVPSTKKNTIWYWIIGGGVVFIILIILLLLLLNNDDEYDDGYDEEYNDGYDDRESYY